MSNDIHYGRKKRGIRMELKKQVENWLNSIEDKDVQTIARNNVIVTGGSIASMLLGEPVNDFDVYFKTKEATKKVAEYYVNQFNKTHVVKNNAVHSYSPEIREEKVANIKGEYEDRVLIYIKSAGIAAEEQDTYSYFESMGEDDAIQFAESTLQDMKKENENKNRKKYRPIFLSENAITLSDKFQIVVRFYGEPDEIHNNYDFAHAKNYWDHKKGYLHLNQTALECLMSRTLIYEGSLYPVASLFRTNKFIKRGWRIGAGQMIKIACQISDIDLTNMKVLREQLTGVDMAYMWQLIKALESVDPEKINSAYISAIVDRIFED